MQQRMLKNIAFFGHNKIAKILQNTLNGGNRKFNLYFDRNEINIIDLANKRFLYPKGAFISIAQNIAQNPLNNDKWKIYANNLRLSKIKNHANSATIEAMNKIADIVGESRESCYIEEKSKNLGESRESCVNFCHFEGKVEKTKKFPSLADGDKGGGLKNNSSLRGGLSDSENSEAIQQDSRDSQILGESKDSSAFGKVLSRDFRGCKAVSKEIRLMSMDEANSKSPRKSQTRRSQMTHPLAPSAREGEVIDSFGLTPTYFLQTKSKQKNVDCGDSNNSARMLCADFKGQKPLNSQNCDSRESNEILPTFSKSKWVWAKPIKNNFSPSPYGRGLGEGVKNPKDSRESKKIFRFAQTNKIMANKSPNISNSRKYSNFFAYFFLKKVSGEKPKSNNYISPLPLLRGGGGVNSKNIESLQDSGESKSLNDSQKSSESNKILNLRNPQNRLDFASLHSQLIFASRKPLRLSRHEGYRNSRNDGIDSRESLESKRFFASPQNDKTQNLGESQNNSHGDNTFPHKSTSINSYNEKSPLYHLPPRFLPQTNIFGLCGGLFLDILLESGYTFHSLLIYEEEAELFALSCYFVDYEVLFSRTSPKSCYIFIENLLDKGLLNHYFYSKKITNNFLRVELCLLQSHKTRDFRALAFETYKANARGWGSFEDEMRGLENTFSNITNAPILRIDSKLKTPICVVGSGPSLESNIDFIRANQSKMLIFSCGTALKVLKAHNIKPDFQIEIERVPYLAEVLQSSNLGDTPLLCASLVDSNVLKIAQNATLFMRGGSASSYIFDAFAPLEFCAPFVGNAGFSLACALSEEVIMCGMDCGFIKGFAKHAQGSIYGSESTEIPRECFKIEGNCADFEVYSNAIFSLSKESFALSIAHYKPKIVHNLSFGAKIKGAVFMQNLSLKNRVKRADLDAQFIQCADIETAKANLKKDALKFIDSLKNALNYDISKPISTKNELFSYIDFMSDFLAKTSEKDPKIGILFEGSISHLLQSAMIALLMLQTNDIKEPFSAIKAIIFHALEKYRAIIDARI